MPQATVAYDAATGRRAWVARFDGVAARFDYAESLAVSPDGSVVVVGGRSMGVGTGYDFVTVGYDPLTGSQIWSARYDGADSESDSISSIAVSPDGSKLFVTGSSDDGYTTIAYQLGYRLRVAHRRNF